jgi:hypothetical protein
VIILVMLIFVGLAAFSGLQLYGLLRFGPSGIVAMTNARIDDLIITGSVLLAGVLATVFGRLWLGVLFAAVAVLPAACVVIRTRYLRKGVQL